ncbi:GGDEF domain-containing protein [Alteromonas aestuariivivens]|uniref:diguanylate cyclase n=1 Tax=Alteromonas aestuariivivens TaxID=1938339 RepID=A0A3D8MCZ5_9ALTE|nr:GGDEF domain-containing protein [Alteromonas aestuariivivens]RDV28043.1 GGDEF domain-containing protein [Alteromonas aestuariivivens]
MENLQVIAARYLPAQILLFIALSLGLTSTPTLQAWLTSIPYFSAGALLINAVIALRFGRSRLVIASLLMTIIVIAPEYHPIYALISPGKSSFTALMAALLVWLLWDQDRGFAPYNLLLTLLQLAAVWIGTVAAFEFTPPLPDTAMNWVQKVGGNSLLVPFTDTELWLYPLLLSAGLLRVTLRPDNNHFMLLCLVVLLPTLDYFHQPVASQLALFCWAIMTFATLITDSHKMAFRDELTGIASRRALMQYVQTLGQRYCVVMADIDHFKSFNDTHGHDLGDQVLRLVASRLNQVGGGGKAFRYGGEEFTLIFARKSPQQVETLVEALRKNIEEYQMVVRSQNRQTKGKMNRTAKARKQHNSAKQTVQVTCSFGIAERSGDQSDFMQVMKQADVALYAAKKAGRNCVKVA